LQRLFYTRFTLLSKPLCTRRFWNPPQGAILGVGPVPSGERMRGSWLRLGSTTARGTDRPSSNDLRRSTTHEIPTVWPTRLAGFSARLWRDAPAAQEQRPRRHR